MNNKNNFGKLKERMFITRALKGSLVALAIFVLGFILLPTLRSEANAAINVVFDADWGAVDLICLSDDNFPENRKKGAV